MYWHHRYVTSYHHPTPLTCHKFFHQKTKFSIPPADITKIQKKLLHLLFQDKFSALVFNHLLPQIFERLAPISLSGLRRLNRGNCHTPNLSYPFNPNWLYASHSYASSIRSLTHFAFIHLHFIHHWVCTRYVVKECWQFKAREQEPIIPKQVTKASCIPNHPFLYFKSSEEGGLARRLNRLPSPNKLCKIRVLD